VNNPAAWAHSQKMVMEAMDEAGLDYYEGLGEAAFYGPKIDIQFRTVTGREETASTCQLDFAMPERLDLAYKGADNGLHRPYIIHRAPLGTHERFVAFLIEHYGGAFPTWLSPVQVMIVPVSDVFTEYSQKLVDELRSDYVRVELDATNDTLNKRLRNAVTRKIPNILVIGEREQANSTVTLRRYGIQEQKTMAAAEFRNWLAETIRNRS
ncbi:MAG TPA: threonine--tRNA ligase, partial [Oligoflexia bacterium]|nr:threonine--tRNA ligase [Oligoflexia bacterium]